MKRLRTFVIFISLIALCNSGRAAQNSPQGLKFDAPPVDLMKLPPGFKMEVYAKNIPNARSMTLSPKGVLFVGSRTAGNVYAILDENKDYTADKVVLVAHDLKSPNGVDYHNGSLYVAEINRIIRFDDLENKLDQIPKPVIVNQQLPQEGWHGWKFIKFGPDGKLYVPVGAPCNVCEKEDLRFASILRMDEDGKNLKLFARGIRNTVGFDWDPVTKELWFTDNGRDELGDNLPPDELNHAPQPGMHFGFPYCHGKNINDPEFGSKAPCRDFTPPAQELGPHVAALGMCFYTGDQFPAEYKNQILIPEHGSWNRASPLGYRITLVKLKDNAPVSYDVFAEGWLQKEGIWGRPVALLVMPDGSLLVSDDFGNAIYRISYSAGNEDNKK